MHQHSKEQRDKQERESNAAAVGGPIDESSTITRKKPTVVVLETIVGESFINNFRQVPQGVDEAKAKLHLQDSFDSTPCFLQPLTLPICPWMKITGINFENLKVKNSATKPILFGCYVEGSDTEKKLLFKCEDIRKDQIVTNLIMLMDGFLKEEADLDMEIITYRCLPTSPEDGLIEIVPNSETIFHIEEKSNLTNWIFDNNGSSTADEIRTRFIRSTAAYCVITYLLGVGDRHLENIMCTRDGRLFHIDFGFILGADPKPLAPHLRITKGMEDAIGEKRSAEFKELCKITYTCLRNHTNVIMLMLLLLLRASPPIDGGGFHFDELMLHSEILERFLPGQEENEATSQLYSHFELSRQAYTPVVVDFFRKHKTETSLSGVSSSIGNLIGSALGATIGSLGRWMY